MMATSVPRAMYTPARMASTNVLSGRNAALYSLIFSTLAKTSSGRLKLLATFTPALRVAPAVIAGTFVGCPAPTIITGCPRPPPVDIVAIGVMGTLKGVMGIGVALIFARSRVQESASTATSKWATRRLQPL